MRGCADNSLLNFENEGIEERASLACYQVSSRSLNQIRLLIFFAKSCWNSLGCPRVKLGRDEEGNDLHKTMLIVKTPSRPRITGEFTFTLKGCEPGDPAPYIWGSTHNMDCPLERGSGEVKVIKEIDLRGIVGFFD